MTRAGLLALGFIAILIGGAFAGLAVEADRPSHGEGEVGVSGQDHIEAGALGRLRLLLDIAETLLGLGIRIRRVGAQVAIDVAQIGQTPDQAQTFQVRSGIFRRDPVPPIAAET